MPFAVCVSVIPGPCYIMVRVGSAWLCVCRAVCPPAARTVPALRGCCQGEPRSEGLSVRLAPSGWEAQWQTTLLASPPLELGLLCGKRPWRLGSKREALMPQVSSSGLKQHLLSRLLLTPRPPPFAEPWWEECRARILPTPLSCQMAARGWGVPACRASSREVEASGHVVTSGDIVAPGATASVTALPLIRLRRRRKGQLGGRGFVQQGHLRIVAKDDGKAQRRRTLASDRLASGAMASGQLCGSGCHLMVDLGRSGGD